MAQFTNQATLSYTGGVVNSNIAVGEILEVLSASKTALRETYARGENMTYVISAVNAGPTALNNVTVTDNLGAYTFGEGTRTPLDYVDGSVRLYIDGILATAPTVATGTDGITFSGITLPAGGNMVLIYEASTNEFAPPGDLGSIVNTATVDGDGVVTPILVTETVNAASAPSLTITKSVEPVPVTDNGTLTYRFVIGNYGNATADAGDAVVLTDTFDPILENLTVTYNGAPFTAYTYDADTGVFATTAGAITVPAATFEQDANGAWVTTPGVATLTVSGTV